MSILSFFTDKIIMKKIISIVLSLFSFLSLSALEIPENLIGIWEGKDRYVFIEESDDDENPEIVIVLKEFYGWYLDRAAEDDNKKEIEKRTRNDATHKDAEHIKYSVGNIYGCPENVTAYEFKLQYSKRNINLIPVAVIDDKMYLNFFIKEKVLLPEDSEYDVSAVGEYDGIWRGNISSKGITVCEQSIPENIGAFIIHDNKLFNIRYWKTGMPYTVSTAYFKYDGFEYYIDRHLFSAGNNYSCTTGRSTKIRNLVAPGKFESENFIFNSDKTILVTDKEPYLVKLADKKTFEELVKIIKEQNAKHKPDRPPLFPILEVDWHWDLINYLEKDNELIQKVRAEQKIKF